jgi:hypothetical protein
MQGNLNGLEITLEHLKQIKKMIEPEIEESKKDIWNQNAYKQNRPFTPRYNIELNKNHPYKYQE